MEKNHIAKIDQPSLTESLYASVNGALKSLNRIKEALQQLKYRKALRIPRPDDSTATTSVCWPGVPGST